MKPCVSMSQPHHGPGANSRVGKVACTRHFLHVTNHLVGRKQPYEAVRLCNSVGYQVGNNDCHGMNRILMQLLLVYCKGN